MTSKDTRSGRPGTPRDAKALLTASNPDDFALKVKGIQSTSDMSMETEEKRTSGIKENIGGAKKATESEFKIDRFGDK